MSVAAINGFILVFGSHLALVIAIGIAMWLDENQWIIDKWHGLAKR